MKKIIALALLAGAVVAANAQNFTEGWENGPATFNDTTGLTFGNSGPTNMAFGSGTWVAFNNSANAATAPTGWFNNETIWAPHGGTQQLTANFNNTTGTNTIDNYMMSMVRTFNNGDTIKFWTRAPFSGAGAFPDRLIVKLSKSGASTAVADFNTTLLTINPTLTNTGYPAIYTEFTATVSGLSGATSGRFAFNYNVTNGGPGGANSDLITIDDVAYTQAVPEPATMAALGLGVAALLRRRRK
ncbi:MAG: choice-of-anchor J domain-containing protein [Fimbriimonadaceae bacterium]